MPHHNRQRRNFSLVELMVAMAILLIMMGFLFQFVNGARRIWMATTATAETFDDGQIALQVMENDLKNIVQRGDDFGTRNLTLINANVTATQNTYLIFPIGQDASGTPGIVIYACLQEHNRNRLFRYQISPTDTNFQYSWFDLTSSLTNLETCFNSAHSNHHDVLVCDDINRLQAFTVANSNFPGQAAAVKLTLSLNVENRSDSGITGHAVREFSKLVFLP